ncbi:MAG: hypothetical protein NC543_13790 [bacterium]|nr:hypothetical protein [bacterium]MCM1376368.1 hypothetical protein [Muribaculum sp.]
MGIGIGSGHGGTERTVIRNGNRVTTRTVLRRMDGTYVGTIAVTKSAPRKTKRLNYNFKEISSMILQTKTSGSARQVAARARGKVALLKQRLKCGEYDDKELESAIIHAEKMERIARKRMRHLQEEETAKRGGPCFGELEEECEELCPDAEEAEQEELSADSRQREIELEKRQRELQQEMQRMTRELMEQTQRELEELSELDELADALGGGRTDLDPEDLDELKRKHRLDEQREIMEADIAYLKALFQKLAQEKQQSVGGSGVGDSSGNADSGVSLELGGMEMPVDVQQTPAMPEGGNIDASI